MQSAQFASSLASMAEEWHLKCPDLSVTYLPIMLLSRLLAP
jgi:hypothetical protein